MGKPCSLSACDRPYSGRGLCAMHYSQYRRAGRPFPAGRPQSRSPQESFGRNTRREGACLTWVGANNGKGYGVIYAGGGATMLAHRWAYERAHGPIPDGMLVDHICHNRACVEVSHLRLATQSENQRNRSGAAVDSSSGFRNIRWDARRGHWIASLSTGEGVISRSFKDFGFALQSASDLRQEHYGEFAGRG